jgi:ribonuclease HI
MIKIYTDGSARGNPGPGGWGAILISDDTVQELGGREAHTTNNRMELTAAIKALEHVSGTDITINTDSEYVMKGMTTWIYNWSRKNWKTANRKDVLNKDLWQRLLVVSQARNIEWKHVPGHSGDKLNDRCDQIATEFADNLSPELYHGPRSEYK